MTSSVHARMMRGLPLLNLIDEHTRECLLVRADRRWSSQGISALADVMVLKGVPIYLSSDNGPEFVARDLRKWLAKTGPKTLYIASGSQWENGYRESFNYKPRDDNLNGQIFDSMKETARAGRTLAGLLQHRQTTLLAGLQTTSARGMADNAARKRRDGCLSHVASIYSKEHMANDSRSFLSAPALQMVLGAIISVFVAIVLDWAKRPKLQISIVILPDRVKQYDVARKVVVAYDAVLVEVANRKRWPRFWPRQAVLNATASISFHDPSTGHNIFSGQIMQGRWASQAQPEVVIVVDGVKHTWNDPAFVSSHPSIDIPWGESEELDVACKFSDEFGAYGFSNENYYDLNGRYRAARWRVTVPSCLVRVEVSGSGESCAATFKMCNIRGTEKLRLEPASTYDAKV